VNLLSWVVCPVFLDVVDEGASEGGGEVEGVAIGPVQNKNKNQ